MSNWYLDSALGVLVRQLKAKYPGIVIGTVGDASHQTNNPSSDHNPEADGSVDAIDPMIGSHFSKSDCDAVINALVASRDSRIKYIIWYRRIIYPTARNGYGAWEWQPYHGTSDPHTGHAHISRNDSDESSTREWRIGVAEKDFPTWVALDEFSLPVLKQGMDDADYIGWNPVARVQDLVGAVADGNYGSGTAAKVKDRLGYGDGKTVGKNEWAVLYGLSKR